MLEEGAAKANAKRQKGNPRPVYLELSGQGGECYDMKERGKGQDIIM